ncbi:endopeptidase La [Mariprofundus erugo]|uniref:Lon protease n=1 Tax=Mariprofundus erugo TaxID=2528639 RepID=A0A5R9GWJ6_9PROT|nr:endopeptidase La [Mariprofundus erugo]TLS69099.1 endopeptidase La [Mariprofundus erugo]TLS74754.1 endopeptidase La [Mariprofundus erugo]
MAEWTNEGRDVNDGGQASAGALPVLPLRDIVVFPYMIVPLFVGREKSVRALEQVMASGKKVLLLAQKDAALDDPKADDLYTVGTIGNILQLLKLPDGTIKVLVEGGERVVVRDMNADGECLVAHYDRMPESDVQPRELDAVAQSIIQQFDAYVKLNKKLPPEVMVAVSAVEEPDKLADTIASHLNLKIEDKQALLEMPAVIDRLEQLFIHMEDEMELLQVDKRIRGRVKRQMEKSQREYYLSEQMKAIQKELGDEDGEGDLQRLEERIRSAGMNAEAAAKAEAELKRLKMMPGMSAEATVVRNYLDWLVDIPWSKRSRVSRDLSVAEAVLEADHYGLEKVKERILEHLAVLRLVRNMKGPILCFVGPPGVGKTSLACSIARATKRKYVRMSLGGVRDEAEIRGHRRTYIGSMPGKVIQSMKKAGTKNPLILLDEIDKLGADFRGDPSAALLEVLDPEQNHSFNDHYMEVDYDLSEVMFITTANSLNIPGPLLDRMEIIRISGYTEQEKLEIARRYLLKKQRENHGLKERQLQLGDDALLEVIRYYTREAGVRGLSRELARLCRKVAHKLVHSGEDQAIQLAAADIEAYLGVHKYRFGLAETEDQIGVVTGLAWTEVGGELLQIETALMPGKGKLTVTGQLGDVMQESIQAALTYVRSRASQLGLKPDFHQKVDIHVHVPEGAIPKDGPSAGLGMATSIVSALTGIPVRRDVCMTGEITLRGKALPIGGLKEKLLAAHRGGLTVAIIPEENVKDLKDIHADVLGNLTIHAVSHMDAVLEHALTRLPAGMSIPASFVPGSVADIYLDDSATVAH